MLDAFIIERIRRERKDRLDDALLPLRIEIPAEPPDDTLRVPANDEQGVIIIDNRIPS